MVVTGLGHFNFIFLTPAASQGSVWRNMFAKQRPPGNRREGTQTNPTHVREGEGSFQKGLKLLETQEPLGGVGQKKGAQPPKAEKPDP